MTEQTGSGVSLADFIRKNAADLWGGFKHTDFGKIILPDAYIDETLRDNQDKAIGRVGYEINFNCFFCQFMPPRKLQDIDAELKQVEAEVAELLGEVTE